MSFIANHLLTAIVFLPLVGAVIALAFPRTEHSGVRGFALAVTLVDFALAVWLWMRFVPSTTGMQLTESAKWIPYFGISYSMGVDGLAILLVLLTTFLAPIVVLSTYSSVGDRVREYMVCLLLLQTGMLGAFVATDLFLFYVFWELMLIPMYFLIGIWGGQRRIYAALKFFLYTMGGSLLMLVAILYTVWAVKDYGGLTFSWAAVSTRLAQHPLGGAEIWLFLAFAVAFAIKVPMFPFHTWLPDAHVEAPTGGSVILAGVLLKLGTFGFLRYAFWLFPHAATVFLPALGLLAVVGIIYGALVAMVQEDLKRLVAFSSVSHLGFVMLGLTALTVTGMSGGVLQMVNHGISTGALFLLVGVIYERRHTRLIAEYGGLAKVMPVYAFVFVLITLSSIGLPGLNGFVGEFMILVGSFESKGIGITMATSSLAFAGMIAAEVVAAAAVLILAFSLARHDRVGKPTKIAAIVGAVALGLWLVAPPMGSYPGGMLIRPLVAPMADHASFHEVFALLAVLAATGVIFAAIYLLWAVQRVFFGPVKHAENEHLHDLSPRERLIFAPLVLGAVLLGVYPKPFLDAITPTVTAYAQQVRQRAGLEALADAGTPRVAQPAAAHPHLRILPRRVGPGGVHVLPPPARGRARALMPWRERLERLRRLRMLQQQRAAQPPARHTVPTHQEPPR